MLYLDPDAVAAHLGVGVPPDFVAPVLAEPRVAQLVDAVLRAVAANRPEALAWEAPLLMLLRRLAAARPASSTAGVPAAVQRALALMDDDPMRWPTWRL